MPYQDIQKRREAQKRYYINNTQKYYLKNLERKRKLLLFVRNIKDKPCMDCGNIYPPYVMDFDHRKGEEKINNVARLVREGWSTNKILQEIEKCDLVCANCHRIRTYKK